MDRDEILESIAKLFKEKGFYHTSIRDISEKVGLRGGSLYYHIKSKEDVLFNICEDTLNTHLAKLETIAEAADDPKTKLIRMIETHVDHFSTNVYRVSVALLESKALGGEYQKQYTEKRDRFESHIRQVLREGIKKGIFRRGDVKLMTFGILGMLNWMVIWYHPEGEWGPRKVKKGFIEMILSGIEK